MTCKVPFTGLTINPLGEVVLCCASDWVSVGHISDNTSLTELYNSEKYDSIREDFSNDKYPRQCNSCWRHKKEGRISRIDSYNRFEFPTFEEDQRGVRPIRFLEFTASNICNQMCATCSGKYSSRWAPWEQSAVDMGMDWRNENHKFHTSQYRMTKEEFQKVLDIAPDLQHLTIKGGEPFADINNIKLLEAIDSECRVEICTNFEILTPKTLKILERLENLHIQASIDGVGPVYNWIREGNFDMVVRNIDRYHQATGKFVSCVTTVSIYNWFNFLDIIKYFENVKGVYRVGMANIVLFPKYCSPLYLSKEAIDSQKKRFFDYLENNYTQVSEREWISESLQVGGCNNIDSIQQKTDPEMKEKMVKWMHYCDLSRDTDFSDILCPELEAELY